MRYKGKTIQEWDGILIGKVLITKSKISFLGDIDQNTARIVGSDLDIKGKNISGKILIFLEGRGSTVGSNVLFGLSRRGLAPKLLAVCRAEPVTISGAIFGNIPMISDIDEGIFDYLKTGDKARSYVQGGEAYLEKEE